MSVMSFGLKTDLPRNGRSAFARLINERLTGERRLSVVALAIEPAGNRVGAGSCQVTEGVSRWPTSGVLSEGPRICMAIVERSEHGSTTV